MDPFLVFSKRFSPTLDRIKRSFESFFPSGFKDSEGKPIKSVVITGSNGKGSVLSFLEGLLLLSGYRVGSFTSPHLVRVEERFRVNGRTVALPILEETARQIYKNFPALTYFEATFMASAIIFSKEKVDYALFEVGMGGRFDATNAVFPKTLVVLTDVSLEHSRYLGPTVYHIAREKAALSSCGVPLLGCSSSILKRSIVNLATKVEGGFPLKVFPLKALLDSMLCDAGKVDFFYRRWKNLIPEYQRHNLLCALNAFFFLEGRNITSEKMSRLLCDFFKNPEKFYPPGRFYLYKGSIIDGAHNPSAVKALLRSLRKIHFEPDSLVFYSLPDKDWKKELKILSHMFKKMVYVDLGVSPRGKPLDPEEVRSFAQKFFKEVSVSRELPHPEKGFLYTGSLYLVGEFFKTFLRDDFRNPMAPS